MSAREKDAEHDKQYISRVEHEQVYMETLREIVAQLAALEVQVMAKLAEESAIDRQMGVAEAFEQFNEGMRRANFLGGADPEPEPPGEQEAA